jgi:hypothetical protein
MDTGYEWRVFLDVLDWMDVRSSLRPRIVVQTVRCFAQMLLAENACAWVFLEVHRNCLDEQRLMGLWHSADQMMF